jgi:hypothetical protein
MSELSSVYLDLLNLVSDVKYETYEEVRKAYAAQEEE